MLAPFVDRLPQPSRLIATEHDGRLEVRIATDSDLNIWAASSEN
jgi:hypothetical protein